MKRTHLFYHINCPLLQFHSLSSSSSSSSTSSSHRLTWLPQTQLTTSHNRDFHCFVRCCSTFFPKYHRSVPPPHFCTFWNPSSFPFGGLPPSLSFSPPVTFRIGLQSPAEAWRESSASGGERARSPPSRANQTDAAAVRVSCMKHCRNVSHQNVINVILVFNEHICGEFDD